MSHTPAIGEPRPPRRHREPLVLACCAIAILAILLFGACGGNASDVGCGGAAVSGPVEGPGSLTGAPCSTEGATCYTPDGCVYWTCMAGTWVYCQCGCG